MSTSKKAALLFLFISLTASAGYVLFSEKEASQISEASENTLGYVKPQGKDVHQKSEADSTWNEVKNDTTLSKDDQVSTGASSTAVVGLKANQQAKQKITVAPNSQLTVRKANDSVQLDIQRGSVYGKVQKDQSLLIRRNKKTFEVKGLSPDTSVRVEVSKEDETKLVVLKGSASVQQQTVVANEEVTVSETKPLQRQQLGIQLLMPAPEAVVWDDSNAVEFAWQNSNLENAVIEVSEDPLFENNVKTFSTTANKARMHLFAGNVYFWRVRTQGAQPKKSPTSSFSYYAMKAPRIADETVIDASPNWQNVLKKSVKLRWQDPCLSESYVIQLASDKEFANVFFTESSEKTEIQIAGLKAGKFYWRVQSKHPTREDLISPTGKLVIGAKFSEALEERRSLASAGLQSSSSLETSLHNSQAEVAPTPFVIEKPNASVQADAKSNGQFWLWFGIGSNYQYFQQSIPSIGGELTFQNIQSPTLSVRGGFQAETLGFDVYYKQTPGKMESSQTVVVSNGTYNWRTLSAEGLYRWNDQWNFRAGFQHHVMPFMALDAATATLDVKNNTLSLLTVGFDRNFPLTQNLRGEWQMRYQHPLLTGSSSGNAFSVSPKLAFDGSLGGVYSLTNRSRLGLYWYGQWHQYGFNYGRGTGAFSGDQTLFYSNFELRYGLEF